jgi:predicted Zn-dependent protease
MAIKIPPARAAALVMVLCAATTGLLAQTVVKLPKNKYTPEQDVKLGQEAAAEVRKQYPIIKDEKIARYLTTLGDRLVAAAPAELKNPVYEYSFTPVNVKEINAFALPGGPMFVNRGMFDAAASEGEVVGVMAHELSHVLLRHGTANASKAQNPWLQLGQLAGQVGGAMVGGDYGSYIAQGSQFGLARCCCDTAATSRSRPTSWDRRSWRAPATTRAISRTCSRRSRPSRRAAGAAVRSG